MDESLRVLVNGLHAKSGGGVTYLRELTPRLAARADLDVTLLLHENQRELYPKLPEQMAIHWVNFDSGFAKLLIWEQLKLPALAHTLKADVTYSPANFGPLFAPKPVVLLRNTLAVGQTDRRLSKQIYWMVLGWMTHWSVRRAPVALAVSRYAGDVLTEGLPAKQKSKMVVVPHGVSPLYSPDGAPREAFLLAVGDIYVQKNLHGLVEALALLKDALPDLTLKIAGRPIDGDYLQRIESRIRELGLGGRVAFLGHQSAEELRDLYRRCRLFVFPSLAETFGNPLVEAMACGAPVACAEVTAMPEVAGKAVQYFDPAEPVDMAMILKSMWTDETLRAEYASRALERSHLYSWEETARKTAEALLSTAEPTTSVV
ncbi:glycosyltransferase family 1 protein [Magnetospira sp. QH-2]|uniref:glycosyltransferase family 4 protein n=1 Tax=Magnetospira sp. (strain QH-2) TaxID=1288970 RepID=UPI0003E80DCB|nr:glycosyltransferase family 1 protein [Magnetospira sp. QH-2]CCQ72747.1 putative GT4 : distantly related to phosphatidylinositol a-mannosyltransferase [Magnetospira sp. QH-2]